MFQSGRVVAESKEQIPVVGQAERAPQCLLAQMPSSLIRIAGGNVDCPVGTGELIVINDECPVLAAPIGVGEDVLIDRAIGPVEIVQQKILAFGKQPPLMK